jgi:hypothetical protein
MTVTDGAAANVRVNEVKIYGHAPIVFWWPGWFVGFVLALLSFFMGTPVAIGTGEPELVLAQSTPHVIFAATLLLLIMFTNIKMRGIYSITFIVSVLLIIVLFAYMDWWERIFRLLPYLSIHINLGFYLFFATTLFVLWAMTFFIFDRLTYWRVRPGQIIEERLIGGAQRTFDTDGLQFEQRPSDLFQQTILGFGAGDLILRTGGVNKSEIVISNVLLANDRIRRAQQLISVKPDAPLAS